MFCARCGQPILQSEGRRAVDHHAATGPGTTVYVHTRPCQQPPQQTYQRPPDR